MRQISFSEAINEAMSEEMRRDPGVFLMGEDVGVFGGVFGVSAGMLAEFGEDRVRDTPISEAAIVGGGLGAALVGMRPIVEIMFADFVTVAMDQVVNQVAKARYMSGGKANVPLTIRMVNGAPGSAAAQHSQSPEAWFMNVPGLKIAIPSTPRDAKGLLKSAIRGEDPVMFFEHKMLYAVQGEVPEEEYTIPFGEAAVRRQGNDVTIIAIGGVSTVVEDAAQKLEQSGVSADVIDPRTLVPLDKELMLGSVHKTGRLVIVEEDNQTGGWAADIAAIVADEAFVWLDAPIKRVSAPDVPPPFAPVLEREYVPSAEKVVAAVLSLF